MTTILTSTATRDGAPSAGGSRAGGRAAPRPTSPSAALTGGAFIGASACFWLAWVLMPGVGVTDAREIFALVSSQRPRVAASVALQLFSAALYAPALIGLAASPGLAGSRGLRGAAATLLTGAMGSAADAVLHLLAFAMTAPGLDRETQVPAMVFMQGHGLLLLAPMILAFFAGGAWLSASLHRLDVVPRWNAWAHALALGVAVGGAGLAATGLVPARLVGLATLGVVSCAQAGIGVALVSSPLR
jgi:hypothetical protein